MTRSVTHLRAPIGVLGGTFDPVHIGHLRPAVEMIQSLGLAELRLVPGRIPPHRQPPRAPPDARLALLHLAIDGVAGLRLDRRELHRDGPSYTVETLRSLRAELGPERPLCFLMGADAFRGLPSWRAWRALTDYAHLVVMHRPGHDLHGLSGELSEWLRERRRDEVCALRERPAGRVIFQRVSALAVSATCVRRCIAQGRSARYLLPEAVWQAIVARGLYGYPQV